MFVASTISSTCDRPHANCLTAAIIGILWLLNAAIFRHHTKATHHPYSCRKHLRHRPCGPAWLCVNRLISATIGAPRLLVAVIFCHHYTDTYYSHPNRNSRRLWPLGPHDLDHARAQGPRLTAALPWLAGSSDRPLAHFIPPLQQAFGL